MSTVTFDTLKFVKTLEASGITPPQAEAIAAAYRVHQTINYWLQKKFYR